MERWSRRQVLRGGLALAGLGLLSGCGMFPTRVQPREKVARIGVLSNNDGPSWETFRQGLRELGYVDGQNIRIEYRWSEGDVDRLPALAAELASLAVNLIVVSAPQATAAVHAATATIPTVFVAVADPVALDFASSLAHPGGNITGLSTLTPEGFTTKQLELLKATVPRAARMAVLINPSNAIHRLALPETAAAADKLGVTLQTLEVRGPDELEGAFQAATRQRADAIHVYGDPVTIVHRARIAELAAQSRLPSMYLFRENVEAGGMMSYGPNLTDLYRRAPVYVDKILKGANPAELPIEQPTKFDFVLNLKTAQTLGLTIPQSVLQQATEIVQ